MKKVHALSSTPRMCETKKMGGTICQAIFQGVEGARWETMYYKFVELHKAAKCNKSGEKHEGQSVLVLERSKREWNNSTILAVCNRFKQDPKFGSLGNPLEGPHSALGRHASQICADPVDFASSCSNW